MYILKYPLSVETSSILSHVFLLIYYAESCQTQKNIDGGKKTLESQGFFLPERLHD